MHYLFKNLSSVTEEETQKIYQALINAGADSSILNKNNASPLDWFKKFLPILKFYEQSYGEKVHRILNYSDPDAIPAPVQVKLPKKKTKS